MGNRRITFAFAALVLTEMAHSIEEYRGRLWESFPPAAFVSSLVSSNREFGFVAVNIALLSFGIWCLLWPVRKQWLSAAAFIWLWVSITVLNGIGHIAWSFRQGGYTPGVLTAPLLIVLGLYLAREVRRSKAGL